MVKHEKIVVVVQARLGSSRLPGKVLLPVLGKPLLLHMIDRVRASVMPDLVVVATTTEAEDDPIVGLCLEEEIQCFRGHSTDLLDRHYKAGRHFHADVVVKIPSDCPLIDSTVINRVLCFYMHNRENCDFVSNLHPASYPDGNDVEVIPMSVLERAWKEAKQPHEREHTTPYIWDNPELFRIGNVEWERPVDYSMTHRWTIDYPEDYDFIKTVYEHLYAENPMFGLGDILRLLEQHPEITRINSRYAGVNWYRAHLEQLKTVTARQTRMVPLQTNIF